jgi:protein TonB
MQGSKLAEIAVNVIRRGPKWEAAQQNGRKVKAFRRQKITFQMPDE